MLKDLWSRLKAAITQIGNLWARTVFSLFYFLIVTPFGLAVRFLSDPLRIKHFDENTFWQQKALAEPTLDEARKQF